MCPSIKFLLIAALLPICTGALAQSVIKGKVVDKNGDPVVGTRITLVETGESVSTDFNGVFEIEAAPGSKIIADCVGMQEKKAVINDGVVITLTKTTVWNRKPNKYDVLINIQCAGVMNSNKTPSFGLMGGVAKQFGGYAKCLLSSDILSGRAVRCDVDATGAQFTEAVPNDYWTTGKTSTSFVYAAAGVMSRLGCPLYCYVGGGYYKLTNGAELYPDESGAVHWAAVKNIDGLALDLGLMLKIGPVTINAGVGIPSGFNSFANFGMGLMF